MTRAQEHPPGKSEHKHEHDSADEDAAPIGQSLRHVANRDNETVTCL
jgi:hypothetical protein